MMESASVLLKVFSFSFLPDMAKVQVLFMPFLATGETRDVQNAKISSAIPIKPKKPQKPVKASEGEKRGSNKRRFCLSSGSPQCCKPTLLFPVSLPTPALFRHESVCGGEGGLVAPLVSLFWGGGREGGGGHHAVIIAFDARGKIASLPTKY